MYAFPFFVGANANINSEGVGTMARQRQCVSLDPEGLRLLQTMAAEHEHNVSQTVRFIVKEAARARGLVAQGGNDVRQ